MQLYIQSNPANYTLASPYVVFCDLSIILLPRPFSVTSLAPCGCYTLWGDCCDIFTDIALQRLHNERHCVSNHQQLESLFNYLLANIKENIKAYFVDPLWGKFIGYRWISPHKGPLMGKAFPGHHNSGRSCGHQSNHTDGLVQDRSISIVNTLEILQSCTNTPICWPVSVKLSRSYLEG